VRLSCEREEEDGETVQRALSRLLCDLPLNLAKDAMWIRDRYTLLCISREREKERERERKGGERKRKRKRERERKRSNQ